jgi:MFS family permease
VLGGIGNGVEAVAARTLLQEEVEQRWMALMMSFNESLFQAVPGAGIVIGGAITALANPRVALVVAGAGALAVGLAAWFVLEPGPGPPDRRESTHDEPSGPDQAKVTESAIATN